MLQRAPEFVPGNWLNADQPLRLAGMRGRALLVDLWAYTSVDSLRSLRHVLRWEQRYAEHGLTVVGVHVPEFSFGRERTQVERAVQELGIRYPVLLDNDYRMWNSYGDRFLPTRYLIDAKGFIRQRGSGAGGYAEFERAIQTVLREINPNAEFPSVRADAPEEEFLHLTRELRGGFVDGALGNPEGYAGGATILYCLPEQRVEGAFYVGGAWQAGHEYLMYRGTTEGIVQLPYEAVEINAILSPHHEAVERMLHPEAALVEIWQDDLPLTAERRGDDATEDGHVRVDRPRVYQLIRNPGFERHELTLRVHTRGFTLYTFLFAGGVRKKAT